MDMNQYLEIFIDESKEHIENLNKSLLELENSKEDMDLINEIFRASHTIKGMAGTMGYVKMQNLTHDMEDVLQSIRNSEMKINSDLIDLLFKCVDALSNYLDEITNSGQEGNVEYTEIIQKLKQVQQTKSIEPASTPVVAANTASAPSETRANSQVEADKDNEDSDVVVIDAYTQNIINKSHEMNKNAFLIQIELNKGCVLKSARAFLIFQTLDKIGEVIKSKPKVEDIEDEQFEFSFSLVLVCSNDKENVQTELQKIAEVDKVTIEELPTKDVVYDVEAEVQEEKPKAEEKAKTVENIAPAIAPVGQAEVKTQAKQQLKTGKTVRVDIDRLDNLMNLVSELIIIKTRLEDIKVGNSTNNQNYNEAVEYLERITTNLHDAVMKVRMVPVERVFNRFPRMIRDLARELNKELDLIMTGEETEVDRVVIDEIGDPLVHLLRNSADHGIESPDERAKAGKPKHGTINLKAYHDGNNVIIEVQDDGSGINIEKTKKKAIEKGNVTAAEAENFSQKDWINLLFRPSFSTSDTITDVSGRGVGLDVVKTKIEALNGVIEVETEHGKGTRFIIRLPLTLAIIQALLVRIGDEKYAIPLSSIKQIIDIEQSEIKLIQKNEVILLRNQVIPLIRLDKVLDVEKQEEDASRPLTTVIVKKSDKVAGLVIDNLIGQQEIVIKSLGSLLGGINIIAGATILGNGDVALILDVNSLL